MTVSELIEELKACDKPDAEVRIATFDSKPNPGVADVYYTEAREEGPVYIEVTR